MEQAPLILIALVLGIFAILPSPVLFTILYIAIWLLFGVWGAIVFSSICVLTYIYLIISNLVKTN
jgi:hypothetical protein